MTNLNNKTKRIVVVGIGSASSNTINCIVESNSLNNVDLVMIDTCETVLQSSKAKNKILIDVEEIREEVITPVFYRESVDKTIKKGKEKEREASTHICIKRIPKITELQRNKIAEQLKNADIVFITTCMGGQTGTVAAPMVAEIAKEQQAFTVAVVTKPFSFEGKIRAERAEQGINNLKKCVDSIIVYPDDKIFIENNDFNMDEAYKYADKVLMKIINDISDFFTTDSDFGIYSIDVKEILKSSCFAMIGIGIASGKNSAINAAKQAVCSSSLEYPLKNASGMLVSITASHKLDLIEIHKAMNIIKEAAGENANIAFGHNINKEFGQKVMITIIATGYDNYYNREKHLESCNIPLLNLM